MTDSRRYCSGPPCLSIYSRCVNAEIPIEQVLGTSFPWCSGWATELKQLFAAYVEAKQGQNVLDYAVLWRKRQKTFEVGAAIFSGCPEQK
jgi:hypothetical protein